MGELIKVKVKGDQQLVSARELHNKLEVKTRFSLWTKQNFKHFREGLDFEGVVTTTPFNPNYPDGKQQEIKDYALTIEMAKHLAMMSGTEKGYQVRDYFIKVEQAWNSPEMVMKRALEIANAKVKALETQNAEMKPKALFADAVSTAKTNILIGELAKILKANGVDHITVSGKQVTMGQNHFFQWLRENGYLIKRKGTDYNAPTQMAMNKKLFKVKESTSINADGTTRINKTTKVTGIGQQYFTNLFLAA